jgi:hypothetical protein
LFAKKQKEFGKMRTQSVGDLEDYFKYGLLRTFAYSSLKLGIHAYNTQTDGEKEIHNSRYTRYLGNPGKYKAGDPELFETIKALLRKNEKKDGFIQRIAQSHLFPEETVFYTDPLSFNDMPRGFRAQHRQGWFAYGLAQLKNCDLVVLAPLQGLEVKSANPYAELIGPRYVALDELKPFLDRQQSLVIHQQVARKSVVDTIDDCIEKIRNATGYADSIDTILFKAGSPHLFFIIPAQRHKVQVEQTLKAYKASPWRDFMTTGTQSCLNNPVKGDYSGHGTEAGNRARVNR